MDSTELEKIKDQKQIEDRKKEETLAELILGKDYTAIIKIDKYEFHVHLLSIDEQIKVIIDSKSIRKDYGGDDDAALIVLTDIIATLNKAIDKFYAIENNVKVEVEQKFWDYIKNTRNPKIYAELLTPLNQKYNELVSKMSLSGDELKKA